MNINIREEAGTFAENKDKAAAMRERMLPTLKDGKEVTLDFGGVDGATQSFIHALLAKPMRELSSTVLNRIEFKRCNDRVKAIISTVTDYLQE